MTDEIRPLQEEFPHPNWNEVLTWLPYFYASTPATAVAGGIVFWVVNLPIHSTPVNVISQECL